jgi:hypothetical protein
MCAPADLGSKKAAWVRRCMLSLDNTADTWFFGHLEWPRSGLPSNLFQNVVGHARHHGGEQSLVAEGGQN